ncbi:MAG: UDP-N-acetylmuramoyl-L-alanine--D-glutamate ligase [Gammaproteobacteria bacterium]|nr:UDP-N-acetylmuramoyl-L-alanine--D-glutamate ligase [Gammaproteobacteria bacterium]MYF27860.1 UDP-N-acetylmuramoyl-L-alanine--D-glutamate ligase [Gammaproteobacteria bacterium]MYK48593.1 UDP-N-acetylmuramoyl-L-alanine--D-glutamate ligase [Gammaproteobacteria bacterium]
MTEPATLVLGLGLTGYSCIRHLAGRERLLALDTRDAPPFLAAVRNEYPDVEIVDATGWRDAIGDVKRVVASPGVAMDHEVVAAARAAEIPVTSDIALFLSEARRPVVGITGTNGKSTVATLVGRLFAAAGRNVGVGGNIGTPALDLLGEDMDGYVLELSSFQLERLERPRLAVGAVLNVSADHLDRYPDVDSYAAAKRRIYDGAERAVYNADDPRTRPDDAVPAIALNGEPCWRLENDELVMRGRRVKAETLALNGRHNRFNALAAVAISHQAGVDADVGALAGFRGLPHRSCLVAEVDGVSYVDDSKATNVGACLAALDGFGTGDKNLVLIAGGDAKGASFETLADAVRRHVSRLVLIGRDAERIDAALGQVVTAVRVGDMREAVAVARDAAHAGDTVLLSPACASFDMYSDFNERGEDFAAEVQRLGQAQRPASGVSA